MILNPQSPVQLIYPSTAIGIQVNEPGWSVSGAAAVFVLADLYDNPVVSGAAIIAQVSTPAIFQYSWQAAPPLGLYQGYFVVYLPGGGVLVTDSVLIAILLPGQPLPVNTPLLSVYRSPLLDFNVRIPVKGTWSISAEQILSIVDQPAGPGTCLIFTPSDPIVQNCRYTVHIHEAVQSNAGVTLPEPVIYSFLSYLTPFYADPYAIRQRLGVYNTELSDEDICYQIWKASVRCNRETMWYFPALWRGGPTSNQVISWNFTLTYAMEMFVELEACIRLIEYLITGSGPDIGTKREFKDSSAEMGEERVKGLQNIIKALRPQWEDYYSEISWKKARVRTVVKGQNWLPSYRTRDRSYSPRRGF